MSQILALAGNPNVGKTSLFNQLTGTRQHVGNWPGVTVEKKEGWIKHLPDHVLVDLPGIYSLSAQSLEEQLAVRYLLNESPHVLINIVDASNLERNLYLTVQLLEMGLHWEPRLCQWSRERGAGTTS
jgi:Fe2+ transport system protein B